MEPTSSIGSQERVEVSKPTEEVMVEGAKVVGVVVENGAKVRVVKVVIKIGAAVVMVDG